MSIESESWLATTGCITPNATRYAPSTPAEVPLRLQNRVKRWLASKAPVEWGPPPARDPEALREKFIHTPDVLPGVEELDDTVAAEWVQDVAHARAALLERWPAVQMRGGMATMEPPLSHDQAQDWLALVEVIEEPFRLMDELEAGALLPAQLAVFEEVYPELFGVISVATFQGVVDAIGKRTEFDPVKEYGVRLILKTPPDEPIVAQRPDEPPPSKKPGKPDVESLTVAQKAAT